MASSIKPSYSTTALNQFDLARAAIRNQDYVALNMLLASGLNPNMCAAGGRYLIHDAVIHDVTGTAIDLLVHYGADVNVRWVNYLGWTPAHIAWYWGRADLVEKLRQAGADLSLMDSRGWQASRPLPCAITRIEAERKFRGFSNLVTHDDQSKLFA